MNPVRQSPGRRFVTDESGQMLPLMAFMMLTLLAMAGYVLDYGRALYTYRQLQASCDAGRGCSGRRRNQGLFGRLRSHQLRLEHGRFRPLPLLHHGANRLGPPNFFSDYTAQGGSGSCISAAQPTSNLSAIFTQIAGDLTVARLIPDNTP